MLFVISCEKLLEVDSYTAVFHKDDRLHFIVLSVGVLKHLDKHLDFVTHLEAIFLKAHVSQGCYGVVGVHTAQITEGRVITLTERVNDLDSLLTLQAQLLASPAVVAPSSHQQVAFQI